MLLASGAVIHVPLQIGNAQLRLPTPQAGRSLVQLSDRFEAVASKVLPAVVAVEAIKPAKTDANGKGKPIEESGSGVIVKSDVKAGYFVITNNHVVGQSQERADHDPA